MGNFFAGSLRGDKHHQKAQGSEECILLVGTSLWIHGDLNYTFTQNVKDFWAVPTVNWDV